MSMLYFHRHGNIRTRNRNNLLITTRSILSKSVQISYTPDILNLNRFLIEFSRYSEREVHLCERKRIKVAITYYIIIR